MAPGADDHYTSTLVGAGKGPKTTALGGALGLLTTTLGGAQTTLGGGGLKQGKLTLTAGVSSPLLLQV